MKTITTTREYDEQGRLVKETVMETETTDARVYYPQQTCTCGSGWCSLHGQHGWRQWPTITCASSIGKTPDYAVAFNGTRVATS